MLLASVQIQKDLIGREKKLGFVQCGLINDQGPPQDLDCHRALVVLWKGLKSFD
ncbi:MAG TPA: hypothetical protein VE078_07345 [Thermoanaerobaculia bacterium]|nr:hypothetical protein [Thermoanaerobaculia bacterium]